MSEEKLYQPGWGEKKHHHHHHHSYGKSSNHTNSLGGWLKMRDRQAYYGLMLLVVAILGFGTYKLVMMFVDEWRAMPHDDPTTEINVDELRIRKVDEQDAIVAGDSLAQEYHLDSIKRHVQIETRPVYRPPKREDKWYITKREWKKIFENYRIWRWEQKHDEQQAQKEEQQ